MKKGLEIVFFTVTIAAIVVGSYYGARLYKQFMLLKQMCVKVRSVNIANLGLKNVLLNFKLGVKNKSTIDIQVNSINLNVSINGLPISQINQSVNQLIQPQSWNDIAFDISFNPEVVFKDLFSDNIFGVLNDYSKINIDIAGTVSANVNGVNIQDFNVSIHKTLADLLTPKTSDNDCS